MRCSRALVLAGAVLTLGAGCASFHQLQGKLWAAEVARPQPGAAALDVVYGDLAGMSQLQALFVAIDGAVVFKATGQQLWAQGQGAQAASTPLGSFSLPPGRHVVRVGLHRLGRYYLSEYSAELEDQRALDLPEGRSQLVIRVSDQPSVDEPGHGLALEFLRAGPAGEAPGLVRDGAAPLRSISTEIPLPVAAEQVPRPMPLLPERPPF